MSARRRASGRLARFAPVPPAGVLPWAAAGKPLHAAGMLIAVAAIVLGIAWARMYVPHGRSALGLLAGRTLRAVHRHRHGRDRCPSADISKGLRRMALAACRRRCVYGIDCRGAIQLDHYRPWSLGGLTALANLMGLCAYHNKVKSNYWVTRDGYVIYHPMKGADKPVLAAEILAAERRARRHPRHWLMVAAVALVSA